MGDPLRETLFRGAGTGAEPAQSHPFAAADQVAGTRIRAGNAMARPRAAILAGARRCLEESGPHVTMTQVAAASGVAKATLYNHFRTRDDVLHAVLQDEVERLVALVDGAGLAEALLRVAHELSASPLRRALTAEPALLCALAVVDPSTPGWRTVRAAVEAALAAERRAGVDLVLRWLASFLINPAGAVAIADDVALLIAALPDRPSAPEIVGHSAGGPAAALTGAG